MKSPIKLITFCCSTFFATSLFAQTTENITIPIVENARVFAQFDDEYPAVVNYFTPLSEQEVISFYQEKYGEIVTQERKRGRLMLKFSNDNNNIRVVISKQNKMRQVDVLVEKRNITNEK